MKATIEYNLPEDQTEYNHAHKGSDYYNALVDFDQYLREIVKYGRAEFKDKENPTVEKIRKQLHEFMTDNNR